MDIDGNRLPVEGGDVVCIEDGETLYLIQDT